MSRVPHLHFSLLALGLLALCWLGWLPPLSHSCSLPPQDFLGHHMLAMSRQAISLFWLASYLSLLSWPPPPLRLWVAFLELELGRVRPASRESCPTTEDPALGWSRVLDRQTTGVQGRRPATTGCRGVFDGGQNLRLMAGRPMNIRYR